MRGWLQTAGRGGAAGALIAVLFVLTSSGASSQLQRQAPSPVCDRFASPSGKNRWPGTRKRPFATIPRLADALRAGQAGCLLRGVYEQDQIVIRHGGRPGAPITIRSAPGTRALVRGRLVIAVTATDIVISGLNLDGRNRINGASPTVLGDRIVFRNNDVTNHHTEICFILGSQDGQVAEDILIDANRIHDCGKLPPQNRDHGIYVQSTRNAVIRNNYIYDNADRGIQLFPDADGTLIENNVIDGNGEGIIFGGGAQSASDNNTVRDNIVTNSQVRANIEYFYADGAPTGQGNVVSHNCVYGGKEGDIQGDGVAFGAQDNVVADPLFTDRNAKDFTLQPTSPCLWATPKGSPPRVQRD
jgi:parallel beta-helix repeat protein